MSIDVELLISYIQERPPLWDQSNKKYLDRDVVINLWKEIAGTCSILSHICGIQYIHALRFHIK
jgi:Alcohol dehydrogenase transcription factor Myb/SANT-like.